MQSVTTHPYWLWQDNSQPSEYGEQEGSGVWTGQTLLSSRTIHQEACVELQNSQVHRGVVSSILGHFYLAQGRILCKPRKRCSEKLSQFQGMTSVAKCLILVSSALLSQTLQRLRNKLQKALATWKTLNSEHGSREFCVAQKERTHLELLSKEPQI